MIYLLFAIGIVVTLAFLQWKWDLEVAEKKNTARHFFMKNGLFFLLPFTGVSGFYTILAICVAFMDRDATTLDTLYWFESTVRFVRDLVGEVKLGAWQSFAVLAFLFVLAAVAAFVQSRPKAHSHARGKASGQSRVPDDTALGKGLARGSKVFSQYSKVIAGTYVTLTLLCSFTFFANELDPRLGKLQLRIKNAEAEIMKVGAGLAKAFDEELRIALLEEVVEKTPSDVKATVQEADKLHSQEQELLERYQEIKSRLRIENPRAELILQEASVTQQSLRKTVARTEKAEKGVRLVREPIDIGSDPGLVTTEKLERIHAAVDSHGQGLAARLAVILGLDERTRLTEKAVGTLLTHPQESVMPLLEDLPFAKPIIEVFDKTMKQIAARATEERIFEPYKDRLAKSVTNKARGNVEVAIQREARELVDKQSNVEGAWKEYLAQHAPRFREKRLELSRRKEALEELSRSLRSIVANRKQNLLNTLRLKFKALAESFESRDRSRLRLRGPGLLNASDWSSAPRYYREDVAAYLERVVNGYAQMDVSVRQIETLEELLAIASANDHALRTLRHQVFGTFDFRRRQRGSSPKLPRQRPTMRDHYAMVKSPQSLLKQVQD